MAMMLQLCNIVSARSTFRAVHAEQQALGKLHQVLDQACHPVQEVGQANALSVVTPPWHGSRRVLLCWLFHRY